jgi:UDP-GlcNAc:undecaprenyl-phosphate/decaprenyl-phosphate GlcNAc-1-phosphate transferase
MTLTALAQHLAFAILLAAVSALAVRAMIRWPILDDPARRAATAHDHPTPKGGGVGVVLAFILGMLVLYAQANYARLAGPQFLGVILAAVAIAGVALADDVKDFRFVVKLGAQAGAAAVALASGLVLRRLSIPWMGELELAWAAPLVTLFWIVGCTNAVNFMDGLDGLVGGTVLIASAALVVIGVTQGGWFVYAAALFLTAGFAGFMPFNWPKARIFMGDVGSQFAGFVLAVLAVAAAGFDAMQISFLIVPLLIFGLLYDAAFTLARRALMRQGLSTPHRTHLYQMAQRTGMPVRGVALAHWGFTIFHADLAAIFLQLPSRWKPFIVLPALVVQFAWTFYVLRRMRRAGLGWRD